MARLYWYPNSYPKPADLHVVNYRFSECECHHLRLNILGQEWSSIDWRPLWNPRQYSVRRCPMFRFAQLWHSNFYISSESFYSFSMTVSWCQLLLIYCIDGSRRRIRHDILLTLPVNNDIMGLLQPQNSTGKISSRNHQLLQPPQKALPQCVIIAKALTLRS